MIHGSPVRSSALLTLAAALAAQGPQFRIDVRTDPGQLVWLAMAPALAPGAAIPGVEGLLRLHPAGAVIVPTAAAGPGGRSQNPVPPFVFAAGMRWSAQLAAIDPQGRVRLSVPYRLDGHGIAGQSAVTAHGLPLDLRQVPDAPDDPLPASVSHRLATGDTVFAIDARRAPVPPPREAGRSGALAAEAAPEFTDMSGLSIVGTSSMTTFPYSATVKLFYRFPTETSTYHQASGVLIDPDHVLTAAHCVYDKDKGGYADKLWVIPGYSATAASTNVPWVLDLGNWGGVEPFGHSDAVDFKTWSDWRSDEDFKHDLAVIELNRPIGALAGWMGIAYDNDCDFYKTNTFYLRGYPADAPYDGSRMYAQSGPFDGCPTKWEARFDELSYAGQSGSGFYDYDGGDRWVHGVLSHAPGWYPNKTDVVRMRDEKYDDIRDWLNDHRGTVVDLTPLAARFDDAVHSTPPSGVSRGSSYALEFTVLNYSRVARTGGLSYTWRISPDSSITSGDTLLSSVAKTSVPVGALETLDLHDTVTIPSGLAPDTYYIGVILTTTDARSGNQHTLGQDVLQVVVH